MSELAIKTTKGMFWSLVENFGLQAVQFLVSIILARLLYPEQFGLIGMLALFIGLAQSLVNSGFGSALIQKKDANHLDACSIFYFNLLMSVALTGLLFLCAPLIAQFYGEPILTTLTRLLSLNVIISAFGLVPAVLLIKRMDFKALVKVSFVSVGVSGVLGGALAVNGMGVWSLAIMSLAGTLIRAVLLWHSSRWRPAWAFDLNSLKTMFPFGSRMLVYGLLETFFQNIYYPLFGRFYSAAVVGYYARAQSMQASFVQPSVYALSRVMFPALAPLQDDLVRLRQAYRKIMTTVVFFHFPLMIGLVVVAGPLITLLMTERWAPSIPLFQLLCVEGLLWPLNELNLNSLKAIGRSDLLLRLDVIRRLLIVLAIAGTFSLGISAVLYGQIIVSILVFVLYSHFSGRLIGYSTGPQIRDFYVYLLMALVMGIAMYLVGGAINLPFPKLLVQTAVGVVVYLGLSYLTVRLVLIDLLHLVKNLVREPQAGLGGSS